MKDYLNEKIEKLLRIGTLNFWNIKKYLKEEGINLSNNVLIKRIKEIWKNC
jgi:hypothetical protein